MGGKTTNTNEKMSATTQPQTPTAVRDPIFNYYGGIDNYLNADPTNFVTPVNAIQQAAFNNSGGLFGAGDIYGNAAQIAAGAASNPLTSASSQGATAKFADLQGGGSAGSQGYNSSSMLEGINNYVNPWLSNLVDTTLSDFDANSAQQKAAQQARYAKAGAFGGSRAAIGEGLLDAELARARSTADAQLRNQAWQNAGAWSQFDAGNRNTARQFGANAYNQAALTNAQLANASSIAQMQAANQAAQFNASQAQQQSQFEAAQANQMALAQKQAELDAAKALAAIGGAGADTYRADLASQLATGNNLYALDQAAINAPITQLETVGGLLNPGLVATQTGQIVNSDTTGQQKTSGGLLNGLLGVASLGVPFIKGYKG